VEAIEVQVQRDEHDRARQQLAEQHGHCQRVATEEAEARESVTCADCQDQRQQRRKRGDHHAIDGRRGHVRLAERIDVAAERRLRGYPQGR
jgi:hypothetical protein